MVRSSFIRMKQSPARSALSSNDSPNSAPHDGSGFGFVPKVYLSRCKPRPAACRVRSAGLSPTYTALHHILSNPVYAGAYTYGKTKYERYLDEHGAVRKRSRHLPMDQWSVLIQDHHPGFIDWATYQANQARLDSNTRPRPHQAGGAVREGSALLQGLVTCGHCGRRLHVHYRGRNSTPGYHCAGKDLVAGRGVYCLNVGGTVIEQAVANAFLEAITPAAIDAMRLSVEQLQSNHDASLSQWRLEVERTRYEAERAERRYRTVEPENRLVARGLETEWESRLRDLATAEMELRRREQQRPSTITPSNSKRLSGSAPTFVRSGTRPPLLIETVRNYCALYWRRWFSISNGPKVART